MFLLFITIYAYIYLAYFFINSKYLEINIRSAEVNTTKEFIANFPAFQTFVMFFYFIIEKLFVFLPPRSLLNNLLHSQSPPLSE